MASEPVFLARCLLDDEESQKLQINISKDLTEIVSGWTPTTRVSPIWELFHGGELENSNCQLSIENGFYLCLLCQVSPLVLVDSLPSLRNTAQFYIGLGLFNLIVTVQEERDARVIEAWCNQQEFSWEIWQIVNCQIIHEKRSSPKCRNFRWGPTFPEGAFASDHHGSVTFSLREYVTLMAQAQARCRQATPGFSYVFDAVDDYITQELNSHFQRQADKRKHEGVSHVQALLVSINSGLSRLTSQAYSGSTPISLTESHYWYHSLLGIGSANIALFYLSCFVGDIFNRINIPGLLVICESINDNEISCLGLTGCSQVPHLMSEADSSPIFTNDNLEKLQQFAKTRNLDVQEEWIRAKRSLVPSFSSNNDDQLQNPDKPIYPITFFSGRDGFRNHLLNLSAPLNSVGGCNSLKWSLLTITHEICHSFMSPIMALIYPNPGHSKGSMSLSRLLLSPRPKNLLDALRQLMLRVLNAQDLVYQNPRDPNAGRNINRDTTDDQILLIATRWHRGIEELMVHLLDYLYFYRSDSKEYVYGIWSTWSVMPHVKDRVEDYVLRTMTAVLSSYCFIDDSAVAMESTKTDVLKHLNDLKEMEFLDQHQSLLTVAIDYIQNEWDPKIRNQLIASVPLIKIAHGFLFSRGLREEFCNDTQETFEKGILKTLAISDPLAFVREHQQKEQSKERESTWLLSILSLCYSKISMTDNRF
ncbi:MAG: hypothetical protein HQL07_07615 [Nitrospirae bacterium]|nr:hypothetical protein [Magnetococcales bacterium]